MTTVENAYTDIANCLIWFVGFEKWTLAKAESSIWGRSTQTNLFRWNEDRQVCNDRFPSMDMLRSCNSALLFLRDDLLRSTGQRIWGLTFTLYPDGKFNIEYDYNKPEGYEETDEVITGDEINASLDEVMNKREGD